MSTLLAYVLLVAALVIPLAAVVGTASSAWARLRELIRRRGPD